LDRRGRLLIGDSTRRLAVFSSSYEFVANIPAAEMGIGSFSSAALLGDGTFLTATGGGANAFRIFDLTRTDAARQPIVRAFGSTVPGGSSSRRIAYSGGTTFWAAPPDGAGLGYVLDLWRTDGTRLRTIRRDVPWMPTGQQATSAGQLPPPEMEVLHEDGTGLIYVQMMIVNKNFLALTPEQRRNEALDGPVGKAIDIYMEVIDANAGVVLASTGPIPPSEAARIMPRGFLAGTRIGYQREEDQDGFPRNRFVEMELVGR
jgi:hypothetical protein